MKKNMGNTDRLIRLLIVAVIIGLYAANVISGVLATILLIASAIFVFTAITNFCPLYTLFGLNSCKTKHDSSK